MKEGSVDEPVISYSAKELLEGMRGEMAEGFRQVNGRLDGMGTRVDVLEAERDSRRRGKDSLYRWAIGAGTVCAAIAAIVGATHG